jgi:hypothetical protein
MAENKMMKKQAPKTGMKRTLAPAKPRPKNGLKPLIAKPKPKPKPTKSSKPSYYVGPSADKLAKATKTHIDKLAKQNKLGKGIR